MIGPLIGAAVSAYGAYKANQSNQQMARDQMQFQERMSNSAYQRAGRDMRAAGINPLLAYSQGGASSPGGSMSSNQNVLAEGVSSARALMDRRVAQSVIDLNEAAANREKANANLTNVNAEHSKLSLPKSELYSRLHGVGNEAIDLPISVWNSAKSKAKDYYGYFSRLFK